MRQLYLTLAGLLLLGVCISMRALGEAPAHGWSTKCRIVEVYDGDTITVEITRRVRVRLLDCWAPEVKTTDATEKARGIASRDHLRAAVENCDATLFVPGSDRDMLGDEWTMGRVLGHVWLEGDKESLSEFQVKAGHATREK